MCNNLHEDSKPIPSFGVGYKIINERGGPVFKSHMLAYPVDKWIIWDTGSIGEDGFCFFLSYEDAMKCYVALKQCEDISCLDPYYARCRIVRIRYRLGLGEHTEENITSGLLVMTALCKSFKILP